MSYTIHPKLARERYVSKRTLRQDRHRDLAIRIVRPFGRRPRDRLRSVA